MLSGLTKRLFSLFVVHVHGINVHKGIYMSVSVCSQRCCCHLAERPSNDYSGVPKTLNDLTVQKDRDNKPLA